jgi:hypothetical protein
MLLFLFRITRTNLIIASVIYVMPACIKQASTLRQAQGDTRHGALVEPWIPAGVYPVL